MTESNQGELTLARPPSTDRFIRPLAVDGAGTVDVAAMVIPQIRYGQKIGGHPSLTTSGTGQSLA